MVNTIGYPKKISEFEIQAILYHELERSFFHVRGCVPARCEDFGRRHKCYLDLVVFCLTTKTPIAVIEVKARRDRAPRHKMLGRQGRRYSKFNVPILVCDRMQDIQSTVEKVGKLVAEFAGEDYE